MNLRIFPNTPEWHTARNNGIGASEAPILCGLNSYDTPLGLYGRKTGIIPQPEDNDNFQRGRFLEPGIVAWACDRLKITPLEYPTPLVVHPDLPFVFATPDAILDAETLMEVKTTVSKEIADQLGDEGTDEIPYTWLIQAQQQMACKGATKVVFAVMLWGRLRTGYRVERNDRLIESIMSRNAAFWKRVVDRNPPEPDYDHPATLDILKAMYGIQEGVTVNLSEDAASAWNDDRQFAKKNTELDKARARLRSIVLAEMGDAQFGVLPDGTELMRKTVSRAAYSVEAGAYTTLALKPKGKK